ncbi:MAG: hypothetical protein F6J97_06325 [Leptolyngbya sp. SIO4C1]|nr:hypothetical protein [Leptolyngbya sp. SIO4C1]
MQFNDDIIKAVEAQQYRVTVGDVAAQTGLDLAQAQQGLLALAADTQAHMQVAESGDIAYEFSRNLRGTLRNKYWQLRVKAAWERVWQVLFYLIRISFGIVLIASIVIMIAAIIALQIAAQQNQDGNRRGGGYMPRLWISPTWFYWFDFDYGRRRRTQLRSRSGRERSELNFLEAIFSFLFGDGDPNADLEERRWSAIAAVIRSHRGAVTAEQIAPYLDDLGSGWSAEYEDYMLSALSRFNGQPQVSPEGELVYYFPELQVTATQQKRLSAGGFLQETRRRFTAATSDQVTIAVGLGIANFVAAIVLGNLLQNPEMVAQSGSFIAFVQSIYWFLWAYGAAFLAIPLVRYFWLKRQNQKIEQRNRQREMRAIALANADDALQQKLAYAQRYAAETVLRREEAIYSTETDLLEQEYEQRDRLEAEWQKRLGQSNS